MAEIAKSVVFVGSTTAVVVLSGDRRVDVGKLRRLVGGSVNPGTPEEVAAATGYVLGGVPPFPHRPGVRVLLDRSIISHDRVWAAAGAPNAVFSIRAGDLARLMGGEMSDLTS